MIKYDDTSQVDKINDYLSNNVLIFIILKKNIDERDFIYVFFERPSYMHNLSDPCPSVHKKKRKKYCIFTTDMDMPQHKNLCPSQEVMKLKFL